MLIGDDADVAETVAEEEPADEAASPPPPAHARSHARPAPHPVAHDSQLSMLRGAEDADVPGYTVSAGPEPLAAAAP